MIIDGLTFGPTLMLLVMPAKRTWAITGIGLLLTASTTRCLFPSHLGLFMNSKNEYIFAESGMHNVSGLFGHSMVLLSMGQLHTTATEQL